MNHSNHAHRIISIGDVMVLLYAEEQGNLRYVESFKKDMAGAEVNFLMGCSRLSLSTAILTRLGKDSLGEYIYHTMMGEQIDTSFVQFDLKKPTAIFLKERLNNGLFNISYYREGTAGINFSYAGLDLNYLSKFNVFYFTGIFPALSKNNKYVLDKILEFYKQQPDTLIVFDPNIRLKLFGHDYKQAKNMLLEYVDSSHIVLLGDSEAKILFDEDKPETVFQILQDKHVKTAVLKRAEKGSVGWDGTNIYHQPIVKTKVVDSCGAGDSFNVGFMYGYLTGKDMQTSLYYGSMLSSLVIASMSDNKPLPYLSEFNDLMEHKTKIYR